WRAEFLAPFAHTDVSNGPTEALNLKIKNTKRTARGFRNFGNYRLRLLLNHGRIQNNHETSRIRTRRHSVVAQSQFGKPFRLGLACGHCTHLPRRPDQPSPAERRIT